MPWSERFKLVSNKHQSNLRYYDECDEIIGVLHLNIKKWIHFNKSSNDFHLCRKRSDLRPFFESITKFISINDHCKLKIHAGDVINSVLSLPTFDIMDPIRLNNENNKFTGVLIVRTIESHRTRQSKNR